MEEFVMISRSRYEEFKGNEELLRELKLKEAVKLPPFQEVIRNSVMQRSGIVDCGDLSDSNLTNEEGREPELFDETCENALKAINTLFKEIIDGNQHCLEGKDVNNLVDALNKL